MGEELTNVTYRLPQNATKYVPIEPGVDSLTTQTPLCAVACAAAASTLNKIAGAVDEYNLYFPDSATTFQISLHRNLQVAAAPIPGKIAGAVGN